MLRFSRAGDAERIAVVDADILQRRALLAIDKVDGRRHVQILDADARRRVPHTDQLFGMGIGQGFQQNAFDDAENHRVRAHATASVISVTRGKQAARGPAFATPA